MSSKNIPFFNYPKLFSQNKNEYENAFQSVVSRGAYILQRDLMEFEEKMKIFLDVKHAFGVADGTNALILGLQAIGIKENDEVIVPSHTFIASAASVSLVGATPILADISADHMLDPESIRKKITNKTKAIMAVQINGRTCDMDQIQKIADDHGLLVIEDAAQAFGSKFKDKHAGTFGAFGTFSFYPAKTLGCFGDGGGIVTNDDEIALKINMLRDHGRNPSTGEIDCWGTNSRLDNLQAAFLLARFKFYTQELTRRREIAQKYHDGLKDISDLTLPPSPEGDKRYYDIYQNYELQSDQRDALRKYLSEKGIGTLVQWSGKAVHQWEKLGFEVDLPETDLFFKRCFMIPMNTVLDDGEVHYIISSIREFYGLPT